MIFKEEHWSEYVLPLDSEYLLNVCEMLFLFFFRSMKSVLDIIFSN